jgi:hypothetical protein
MSDISARPEDSNLTTAYNLAARGFAVFPVRAGYRGEPDAKGEYALAPKQPTVMSWKTISSNDARRIESLWRMSQGEAVAIDIGKSGKLNGTRFVVVDADRVKAQDVERHKRLHAKWEAEGRNGAPPAPPTDGVGWIYGLFAAHDFDPMQVPTVASPSGGLHFWFRVPAGAQIKNSRGSLKKAECGVDIKTDGGYVLAPGSRMDPAEDGSERVYEMLDDSPELQHAPELPQFIVDLIAPIEAATEEVRPSATIVRLGARDGVGARERAYARSVLDAEISNLASTPPGGRNDAVNAVAYRIGRIVGAGWLAEAEGRQALMQAVGGWKNPKKTIGTLNRGFRSGMTKPIEALPVDDTALDTHEEMFGSIYQQADAPADIIDPETGEVIEDDGIVDPPEMDIELLEDPPIPDCMIEPPGLIGKLSRWIQASSIIPQPALATGAALALLGGLISKQVDSPKGTNAHLFMIYTAESGKGKNDPQRCVRAIIDALGYSNFRAPGVQNSENALMETIRTKPVCMMISDEIADVMKKMNARNAPAWMQGMKSTFLKLYNSKSDVETPNSLSRLAATVKGPCLTILGASTPDTLVKSFGGDDLENGLINRLLVIPGDPNATLPPGRRFSDETTFAVDQWIVDDINRIFDEIAARDVHGRDGSFWTEYLKGVRLGESDKLDGTETVEVPPESCRIRWSPEARDYVDRMHDEIAKETGRLAEAGSPIRHLWPRVLENSIKLSMIFSVSDGRFDEISYEHAQMGFQIAHWSLRHVAKIIRQHSAGSLIEDESKTMERIIMAAGFHGLTTEKLTQATRAMRDTRNKTLIDLIQAGIVIRVQEQPTGGRPAYRLYHHMHKPDKAVNTTAGLTARKK